MQYGMLCERVYIRFRKVILTLCFYYISSREKISSTVCWASVMLEDSPRVLMERSLPPDSRLCDKNALSAHLLFRSRPQPPSKRNDKPSITLLRRVLEMSAANEVIGGKKPRNPKPSDKYYK